LIPDNTAKTSSTDKAKKLANVGSKKKVPNRTETIRKAVVVSVDQGSKPSASAMVSLAGKGIDSSWLEGTNVIVTKKVIFCCVMYRIHIKLH